MGEKLSKINKFSESLEKLQVGPCSLEFDGFDPWMSKFGIYSFKVLGDSTLGKIDPCNNFGQLAENTPQNSDCTR